MHRALAIRSLQRTAAQAVRTTTIIPRSAVQSFHHQTGAPYLLRKQPNAASSWTANFFRRHQSTGDRPLTDRPSEENQDTQDADTIAARKALSPAYQLWFTCKTCLERSGHTISKQAYHFGTCVITCPKCKSQHLISDNLKIFSDANMTLEDIAKQHGEKLKKGRLGVNGDIEFYDDEATGKVS